MINYKGLPQRLRRIGKQYEYCIEKFIEAKNGYRIELKEGYQTKEGLTSVLTDESDSMFYSMKSVTKPATRVIRTALYGFPCPICGRQTSKGSNYTDLGGMKICGLCG
jgi:hypothetical protein